MEEQKQNNIQKLAIDIGYGHVKVIFGNGEDENFKFVNAIAKVKETFIDEEIQTNGIYNFNGHNYKVGEIAINNSLNTRNFDYQIKNSQLLIYHAIKLANFDTSKPIELCLGLSIFNWYEKDKFLESFKTINVDNTIIKPTIFLLAQGQGVYESLESNNRDGITCIVDMGYYTFDFLVFEDGKPNYELSYAAPLGMYSIVTELETYLSKKYHFNCTEQIAKKAFNHGSIKLGGDEVNLTDMTDELKDEYIEMILSELKAKRKDILLEAKRVVFSGGGAYYLKDDHLPINVEFSKKPYEFANVRGYYAKM